MVDSHDLARLLSQLRSVSSPIERMRLIARAWRSVRRLSPRERDVLARQIGLDGAEELIEGIAVSRGGLSPATVQRTLDRLREVEPGRLKQTLQDLRDPERRRMLIDRGLTAATDVLAGVDAAEEQGPEPEAEIEEERPEPAVEIEIDDEEPPALSRPGPADARPEPTRPMAAVPLAAAVAPAAVKPHAPPRPTRPAAPPRPAEPERSPERGRREPAPAPPVECPEPPTAQERARRAAPPVTPAPVAAAERRAAASEEQAETEPFADFELLWLVESRGTLFRRLRALRENAELARGAGPERLRALLDLFSPRWARRRVVSAMIEARVPDSLEEAIFLIGQLGSRSDRRWCAGTLVHEWELSEEERERIEAAHDSVRGAAESG